MNTDYRYDPHDVFHQTVAELVFNYGAGDPIAIVWKDRHGVVITQCQYGLKSYPFSILYYEDRFTIYLRGHQKTVKSDYFFARS
jgi:hypothetical protein